jgi:hypothetical protein
MSGQANSVRALDEPVKRAGLALDVQRLLLVGSYALVGAALLWSRLFDLGHSFWYDELYFVAHFVREGPGQILAGPYVPNDHELYGLLTWAAASLIGESETAFRLLSALPFVAGVVVVTAWLHTRVRPLAGLLYVFLATVSPLLFDVSRQARGYGLAYLAMSVLMVAALEANRTSSGKAVATACAAGVIGTWTLPHFGIAFAATALVLLADRRLRRPALIGLLVSGVAIAAWYGPHLAQIHASSQHEDGFRMSTEWLVTAPIDQILLPGLIWIDGVVLLPGAIWLPLVLLALLVMGSSPLLHERRPALILCSGVVATILVFWATQTYVFTRFLSYLLVPSLMLAATGASFILVRPPGRRPAILRSLVCVVAIALLAARFVTIAPDDVRLPREANRDAAEFIDQQSSRKSLVLVYTLLPEGLAFYLDRPIQPLTESTVARRVCSAAQPIVYVMQPMTIKLVDVPCLDRAGVRRGRFRQYARGGEIDVWFVPPAPRAAQGSPAT